MEYMSMRRMSKCSTHGKYDELQAKFLSETPKERDYLGGYYKNWS
jgi:hypothetical protein